MTRDPKPPDKPPSRTARINLVDLKDDDESPELAVYVQDRAKNLIHTAQVDEEGNFDVPPNVLQNAHYVSVGPAAESFHKLERGDLTTYRANRFREILQQGAELEFSRRDWGKWLSITQCVSGRVTRCYQPWVLSELLLQASVASSAVRRLAVAESSASLSSAVRASDSFSPAIRASERLSPAIQVSDATRISGDYLTLYPFFQCDPVCDGLVEVYQRRCCCLPWIVYDPRLPELIFDLEDVLRRVPKVKWPPRPLPDPPPIDDLPFLKSGALDERALNAGQDLLALRSLPATEIPKYVEARPYLWCRRSCGTAVKVGQGFLNPDGKFNICWNSYPAILLAYCHYEYAYVVKQIINGTTVTIYDGVAANAWFGYDEEPNLVSYHPKAIGCRHNDFPGTGAFALLQDIGATPSNELKTPNAAGWDRVAAFDPNGNSGLVFSQNRNWGGTLALRYHFSEPLRTAGGKYYRISVRPTDATGAPTGAPTYLSASLSWDIYSWDGTGVRIDPVLLGPNNPPGGETGLFLIPYDADAAATDREWASGQYHGYLDTTQFTQGRYLLTLEIFNAAGQRIRPNGSAGPGIDAGFTYRRRYQLHGDTAEVPFAALTHLFWWDNRKADADIVDLRMGGAPSTSECQFMSGTAATTFSVGYRAYHPNPRFLESRSLWWQRGLNGPTGTIESGSDSVGRPPDPVHVSVGPNAPAVLTFGEMLGPNMKCSFALNLHATVKTWNGSTRLSGLDDSEQAAFALDRTPPPSP